MPNLFFQGDICLLKLDVPPTGTSTPIEPDPDGAVVVGRGEVTGHRHAIFGGALLFRDDALARADSLYVGDLKVQAPSAELVHEEHASILLKQGHYRVSRQREADPRAIEPTEMLAMD